MCACCSIARITCSSNFCTCGPAGKCVMEASRQLQFEIVLNLVLLYCTVDCEMSILNCSVVSGKRMIYHWMIVCCASPGLTVQGFYKISSITNIGQVSWRDMRKSGRSIPEKFKRETWPYWYHPPSWWFGGSFWTFFWSICWLNKLYQMYNIIQLLTSWWKHKEWPCPTIPCLKLENNQKDKQYNSVISFLQGRELAWRASEMESHGKSFVKALSDLMWYIDDTILHLMNKNVQFLQYLRCFTVQLYWNSWAQKREHTNLSHVELCSYRQSVYRCLLNDYWK